MGSVKRKVHEIRKQTALDQIDLIAEGVNVTISGVLIKVPLSHENVLLVQKNTAQQDKTAFEDFVMGQRNFLGDTRYKGNLMKMDYLL